MDKKLLSVKEAAAMLGVTPLTLRNWDKNGKLQAMRHPLNNYRVYKLVDIENILDIMSAPRPVQREPSAKRTHRLEVRHLDQ